MLQTADLSIYLSYILRKSGFLKSNILKFDPFWQDLIQLVQKTKQQDKMQDKLDLSGCL